MEKAMSQLALGIDLGGTNIRVGTVHPSGKLLAQISIPTHPGTGRENIIDRIVHLCLKITKDCSGIIAAGVGAPGPLNSRSGIVSSMPNLPGWENFPLRDSLAARLSMPVHILNDADAFAWYEYKSGITKSIRSFALITLGTGLGSAIVINGRLWEGSSGFSPELGHVPVSDSGDPCGCGQTGHLESFVSSRVVCARVQSALDSGRVSSLQSIASRSQELTVAEICNHARSGDALANEEVARYAKYLGRGMAILANLLNLELVVISGGISRSWDLLEPIVRNELRLSAFPRQAEKMKFITAERNAWGGVIGAGLWSMINTNKYQESAQNR